jgi:hypothetical protein
VGTREQHEQRREIKMIRNLLLHHVSVTYKV